MSFNDIGLRNKIDQASDGHNYLGRYEYLLSDRKIDSIALVLGNRPVAIANSFAEFLPKAIVTAISYAPIDDLTRLRPNVRLHSASNMIQTHRALASASPFDVVVEDSQNRKSQKREMFRQFFPAVRSGGLYIAEDLHASYLPTLIDDDKEDLWELISRLLTLKGSDGKIPAKASQDDLNLARAIERVDFDGKFLAVESRHEKTVKLRHSEVGGILQKRYGDTWGRVVEQHEGFTFSTDALVTANQPDLAKQKYPNPISVPEIYVREYYDVVAVPRQVLLKDEILLPDSFRLALTGRLHNTALKPLNHYYAWSPLPEKEPERLEGQYYYLDLEYNRHFGHFMTEAVPRLYAWDAAKKQNPSLKLLISSPTAEGELLPYQLEILMAYGIEKADIQTFRTPVRINSLVSAMPLFHNGKYVHPMLQSTFEKLGRELCTEVATTSPKKIFVSRRRGMWRECLNMDGLEALFISHGFEVTYPEELSLRDQATMFANATVAAGYIGSGLYSAMFNSSEMDIIGFINTSYQATNEYFIAATMKHRMHVFWCDDIKGNREFDNQRRALATTNYDYEFDFERDGDALLDLLSRL